jgi:hypothetical protein
MKNGEKLSIDEGLALVGSSGKYQKLSFLFLILQFFISTFLFVGGPYLFLDPTFICSSTQSDCTQK